MHIAREPNGAEATPSRFLSELPQELVEHVQAYY